MSEAEAVVALLERVSDDTSNWDEIAKSIRERLADTPSSFVLHGAAVLGTPPAFITRLELDPQLVAAHSTKLVEDSGVARRQYQRVIGEHTRVQTFDMLGENPEGYARTLRLLSDNLDYNVLWEHALGFIGRFSLEPFKVLSLWVALLLDYPDRFDKFVEWAAQSVWNGHADWAAVFKLVGQWQDLAPLIAKLVMRGVVPFEAVYTLVDPTSEGFAEFEQKWESSKTENEVSALAMAMPLVDDDDEDEEEMDDGAIADNDDESAMAVESESVSKEEQMAELETRIENLFVLVGKLLTELSKSPQKELESTLISLVFAHPVAFGTSRAIAEGLSDLIAARLPEVGREGVLPLIMSHAILEPAWSALSEGADLEFFRKYLLPSLDLHPEHQPILWNLPAVERYAIYTDLYTRVAQSNLFVKARFSQAEKDAKDVLKRLTKQDAETLIVPQLMEIFARCPWPSLNVFVNQVESYNIGQLVARSSSSQIASLAMDMLPLILMQQFTAAGRQTKQDDGLFDQRWFRLLAQFAGDVAVAYENFDFVSLIKLVLQQFAERDFSEVVVIEQLLKQLSGLPDQSNLSVAQLLALSTGEPVSTMAAAAISEQHDPQQSRLLEGLREEGLLTELFVALSFAYVTIAERGGDAKVVANRLDQLTSIILTFVRVLDAPLDSAKLEEAGVPPEFRYAATRDRHGSVEFANLDLYDIVMEQELYDRFTEVCDAKAVERASLSHRLRVKSTSQQLGTAVKPSVAELVARLLLSPSDALFTSRFVQATMPEIIPELFKREVALTILRNATPFEAESFATFLTDLFTFLYTKKDQEPSLTQLREYHEVITSAVLEAAYPGAPYTPLSNTFALLQRILPVYPLFQPDGQSLSSRMNLLSTEMKGDLETAVKSLNPQLSKRADLWQSTDSEEVSSGFLSALSAQNDRLMHRLISSVNYAYAKMNEKDNEEEKEKEEEQHARSFRRSGRSGRRRRTGKRRW